MNKYYSNGKLLLTGEYFVLHGAKALAIPLKVGQSMTVKYNDTNENVILWNASDVNGPWFSAKIALNTFKIIESSNQKMATYLAHCLKTALSINPTFLQDKKYVSVDNHCSFNINWGFGSSSTFLTNVAWWANIDPFHLHQSVSEGSGYDIACAISTVPIIYSIQNYKRSILETTFNPSFISNLFLVYTGKKQDTSNSIKQYKTPKLHNPSLLNKISNLTEKIIQSNSLEEFILLIEEHESIVAKAIDEKPVKQNLFKDFNGAIKSLGAWGGDFLLSASPYSNDYLKEYFTIKGLPIIIPLPNLLINS